MANLDIGWVSELPETGNPGEIGNNFLYKYTDEAGLPRGLYQCVGPNQWEPVTVVRSMTVTLTDAQIKALPTTAIELVPAPGAGKVVVPIKFVLIFNNDAGAYGNADQLPHLDTNGFSYGDDIIDPAGLSSIYSHALDGMPSGNPGDLENQPIMLKTTGNVGNYTGGNAANYLKVTTLYIVVEI